MLGWRKDKKDGPDDEARPVAGSATSKAAVRDQGPSSSPATSSGGPPRKRLGDMLLEEGVITRAQLEEALARKEQDGAFIGKALVELGFIDQKTLMSFLVKQCKIPHISLLDYEVNSELLKLVPKELCLTYHLIPIDKLGKILTVAMADPLDEVALEELRACCPELRIKPILCDWDHFVVVARRLFTDDAGGLQELTAESLFGGSKASSTSTSEPPKASNEVARNPKAEEAAVEAAVEQLIKQASGAPAKGKGDAAPGKPADSKTAKAAEDAASARTLSPSRPARPASAPHHSQVPVEELADRMQMGFERVMKEAMAGLAAEIRQVVPATPASFSEELVGLLQENLQSALRETLEPFLETIRESAEGKETPPPVSSQELASAVADTVRETVQGAIGTIAEDLHRVVSEREAATPGPSPQEFADLLNESVRGTMQDAVTAIVTETSESLKTQLEASQPSADALAERIRESVQDAMQDVVSALSEHTRRIEEAIQAEPGTPSAEELATMLRSTVQEAMHGMTEALAEQARQIAESRPETPVPTPEDIADAIRSSVQDSMRGMTEALSEQTRQLAELAKADDSPSPEEMAAAIRSSMQDSMREMADALHEQTRQLAALAQADDGPSPEEMAAAIRSSVQDSMREMVAALTEQTRHLAALAEADDGPTPEAMAEAIRSSMQDSMREMASALHEQTRQLTTLAQSDDGPSPEDMAAALGASVRGAMEDALKNLAEELAASKPDEGPLREALTNQAVQTAQAAEDMRAALNALREAIQASHEAQVAREAHLSELLERTLLAAQEAQAAKETPPDDANSDTIVPLYGRRRGAGNSAKYASVTLLRQPSDDTIDAIRDSAALGDPDERVWAALDSENPLEALTFDNYYVGKANSFTFTLAKAVAESPGKEYNPFFLYGEVGTGKTHLINAIANAIQEADRDIRVGYVSAGRFASRLVEAVHDKELDAFREGYCHCDVLVFDDVQFLAGHVEVQEEFFHIFNALQMENRQIILAADRAPDKIGQLEKRLVSRFSGGIVANLSPPDWESRIKILRRQGQESGIAVPEDILALIATRVSNDVRKMTGCLRKVIAFAKLMERDLTCDLAVEILTHLGVGEAA
jgi:chromosomal replication initiator protein DnaA